MSERRPSWVEPTPRVRPSEARRRILDQHSRLREGLDALDGLAAKVLGGELRPRVELRSSARELIEGLEQHMHFEERVLTPVLRDADPWGPERLESFLAEHARQREVLRALAHEVGESDDPVELALLARGFVAWLRDDMREEESAILNSDLLRDDSHMQVSPEPD